MRRTGLLMGIMILLVSSAAVADTHSVVFSNNTLQWSPNPLEIYWGDEVSFRNCSTQDFIVFQVVGDCDYWETLTIGGGYPGCGARNRVFDGPECPENGQEIFMDSVFGSTCTIIYINPTPTPTPTWYGFPSTTPTGLGITLIAMGILMMLPVLRRHRQNKQ